MKVQTQQFCAVYRLRVKLLKYNYFLLAFRLLIPIVLATMLVITPKQPEVTMLQHTVDELHLPRCFVIDSESGPYGYGAIHRELSETCKTLGFFPDSELTRRVASIMARNNNLMDHDIVFFDNEDEYLDSDLLGSTEYVIGIPYDDERSVVFYYNYSKLDPDMYQLYARDAFAAETGGYFSSIPLRLQLQTYKALLEIDGLESNITIHQIPPGLDYTDRRLPKPFITTVAIIFLTILQLLTVLYQLAYDKEKHVIGQLRLLGCVDSLYLLASFVYEMTIWIVGVMLFTIIVKAVPNTSYFHYIDVETVFVYLFLAGLATTSFAFFVASFTFDVKSALFVGIVYVALHICSFIIFTILTPDHFYDKTFLMPFVSGLIYFAIPFIPQLIVFSQMLKYVNATVGIDSSTMEYVVIGNIWYFGRNVDYKPFNYCLVMSTLDCTFQAKPVIIQLVLLAFQAIFYFVAAWGLYELLDNNYSLRRNFWYVFYQRKQLHEIKTFAYASMNRRRCTADEVANVLADNDTSDYLAKQMFEECLTGPNDSQKVLQTHSLHKTFGQHQAVKSATLQIRRAQCLALLGQNGCGKTTTINMLIGALRPDKADSASLNQGYINGFDVRTQAQLIRQQIGVCPQFSQLFECLTPVEHLTLAYSLRNVDKRDIERNTEILLKAMQLWGRKDDQISQFSGGMRRRVSIAMALVNNNQLVFLDEPTGSLDPQCKRVIWDAIKYIQTSRRKFHSNGLLSVSSQPGVLLTTHDMVEAEALSNSIAIMDQGQILTYGNALQLMKNYSDACNIYVLAGDEEALVQRFGPLLQNNADDIYLDRTGPNQYRLELYSKKALPYCLELLDELTEEGCVYNYVLSETTLEQVFLNITSTKQNELKRGWADREPAPYRHYRSVFKKLVYQDTYSFSTLLGYVILPIGLLVLCLLVAELLIPWIISMVNVTVENMRRQSKPACGLCKTLYKENATRECTGFDAYQNMRLCTFMDKINEKSVQLPEFGVGGFQTTYIHQSQYHAPVSLVFLGDAGVDTYTESATHDYTVFDGDSILDPHVAWARAIYDVNDAKFPFNLIEHENGGVFTISPDIVVKHDSTGEINEYIAKLVLLYRAGGISNETLVVNSSEALYAARQLVFDKIPVAILQNGSGGLQVYSYMPYNYPQQPYSGLGQRIRLAYDWIANIEAYLNVNLSSLPFVKLEHVQSVANQAVPQIFDFDNPLSGKKAVGVLNDVLARVFNYQTRRKTTFTFKTLPHVFTVFIEQAYDRAKVLISLFFLLLVFFSTMPILMFNVVLDKQSRVKTLYRSLALRAHEYWLVNIAYYFAIAIAVHLLIYIVSRFIFNLSIYNRIQTSIVFIMLAQSVATQVSMSVLLSLFFSQTAASTLCGYIIVVIVSLVVLVFGKFETGAVAPWYFITPLFSFAASFLMVGSGGYDVRSLREEEVFMLVGWTFVQSAFLLLVCPLADWLINSKTLGRSSRKQAAHAYYSSFNSTGEPPLRYVRPLNCHLEVNTVPGKMRVGDDAHGRALLSEVDDPAVLQERAEVQRGVPANSLLSANAMKYYGRQLALRDVSLHFERGEVFGLLGASGAGKSTYIALLAGLERPSKGLISLGGAALDTQRKRIGVCLYDDVFVEALTVRQHLEIFALVKGFPQDAIPDLAGALGIAGKLDVRVQALSGGMRRRMNLAISLM